MPTIIIGKMSEATTLADTQNKATPISPMPSGKESYFQEMNDHIKK